MLESYHAAAADFNSGTRIGTTFDRIRAVNLYVHFPFCRSKCAYCALYSAVGRSEAERQDYSVLIGRRIAELAEVPRTVYFGGGSPGFCPMPPLPDAWRETPPEEFTVELNPRDVTDAKLAELHAAGVNRISMGVQSFDDDALRAMGRGHTAADAEAAFRRIRAAGFTNAGIDLIAGWPGTTDDSWRQTLGRAVALGLDHCSVYTLIREPKTLLDLRVKQGQVTLPSDDDALRQIDLARAALAAAGLERYEISNYAKPGRECRHNLAVWHGEDYLGLGPGAHARVGRERWEEDGACAPRRELLSPVDDAVERAVFALRLPREGLDLAATAARWPVLGDRLAAWRQTLDDLVAPGIVEQRCADRYALTPRGLEVCDAVIAELE